MQAKCKIRSYTPENSIMTHLKKRSECPISRSLEIWGDKWSLLIIRDLMFAKTRTYGDFLKSPEKIATNILASRLDLLEENGIVEKKSGADNGKRAPYVLTEKGVDMLPILMEIHLWAEKHLPLSDDAKALAEEMKADKAGFAKKVYE